jgi:hypothetical protein
MNFLAIKNDDKINAAIPKELRKQIQIMAAKKNMNESVYIKVALINQVQKDLNEAQSQ